MYINDEGKLKKLNINNSVTKIVGYTIYMESINCRLM